MMKNWILLLAVSPLALSACAAPLAVGAAASGGIAASQERGFKGAMTDAEIQAKINQLWFEKDIDIFRKLDLTVNQGRVLITGIVQNPEHRVEAVRLAWQPEGVKQVINEIRVAKSEGITGFARDTWISTRLRSAITFNRDIYSINYTIDTVQGTVYLMGTAQNQQELNRVIEIARTIPDVKQVVSYVKVLDKPVLQSTRHQTRNSGTSNASQPQADSLGAESWPDETPTSSSGGGVESQDYNAPVTLVPQPVEVEQLN